MSERYTVIGRSGRFYAVDLSNTIEVNGRSYYAIVGNVCGYADVNSAWSVVLAESEAGK